MQLASSTRAQDGFMAAMSLWGKKPHQGSSSENVSLHPGAMACNSTTALGVSWRQWSGTVPGATVTYDYDAFGNKINSTGSTPNQFLYRGEFFDSDLGLYYLRARYYNPITSRFMSRDSEDGSPYDPKTLHKYLYALDDPINFADPMGRASILETGSLDQIIGRTPVPALVELAGGAYASAASWAVNQYLIYAASTSNVVEAVGDFIEAVDWAELSKGLSKVFLCEALQSYLETHIQEFTGEFPANVQLIDNAEDKFQELCWELAGKVRFLK